MLCAEHIHEQKIEKNVRSNNFSPLLLYLCKKKCSLSQMEYVYTTHALLKQDLHIFCVSSIIFSCNCNFVVILSFINRYFPPFKLQLACIENTSDSSPDHEQKYP